MNFKNIIWIKSSEILARRTKQLINNSIQLMGTYKDRFGQNGPIGQNLPRMPIKGPRDYDYWRRLRRNKKNPKDKLPKRTKGICRRPAIYNLKKKQEESVENDEIPSNSNN